MDFSILELNYNSVETIPGFEARAAFTVNSGAVFCEDVDIIPTVDDQDLSFMPWGVDNLNYDKYKGYFKSQYMTYSFSTDCNSSS